MYLLPNCVLSTFILQMIAMLTSLYRDRAMPIYQKYTRVSNGNIVHIYTVVKTSRRTSPNIFKKSFMTLTIVLLKFTLPPQKKKIVIIL